MLPPSQIVAYWIPMAEAMPSHGTHCLVGNAGARDTVNPWLGAKWKVATFSDRQKLLDEMPALMTAPLIGPRFVFQLAGESTYRGPEEFTHWWPIPHPFSPWNGKETT